MAANNPPPVLRELRVIKDGPVPPETQRIFVQHGIEWRDEGDTCLLTFPEGTVRIAGKYPRVRDDRYAVMLPDRCTIGYAAAYLSGAIYLTGGGSICEHKLRPSYMQHRHQVEEAGTDAEC